MNMWGTQAAFPDLGLNDLFTDDGAKVVDRVFSNKCMHSAADTLNYAYASQYKTLLNPKPKNTMAWISGAGSRQRRAGEAGGACRDLLGRQGHGGSTADGEAISGPDVRTGRQCRTGGNFPESETHCSTPGAATPLFLRCGERTLRWQAGGERLSARAALDRRRPRILAGSAPPMGVGELVQRLEERFGWPCPASVKRWILKR